MAIHQNKEGVGGVELEGLAHGRSADVQQERAFADAAWANQRDALPVAEQAKDLFNGSGTAVKISRPTNGATVEEWVHDVYWFIGLLVYWFMGVLGNNNEYTTIQIYHYTP